MGKVVTSFPVVRCANPACGKLLALPRIGRRPKYCGRRCKRVMARRDWETAYRQRNREKLNARQAARDRRRREADPEAASARDRANHLKHIYGISVAEYDAMLAKQGGRCAICPRTDSGSKRSRYFHVDHDHATGRVRGLLCTGCNTLLGYAQESPAILLRAVAYLEATKLPRLALVRTEG